MLNVMSLTALRQLFMRPLTNPFPALRLPENMTEALQAASVGKIQLNPPVPAYGRFRGRLNYDRSRCIGCGMCLKVCPANAITRDPNDAKKMLMHNDRCCFCSQCNDVCPVSALSMTTDFAFASTGDCKNVAAAKDSGPAKRLPFQKEWLDADESVEKFLPPPREPDRPVPEITPARSVRQIDPRRCVGCTLCLKKCPVGAIIGGLRQLHRINAAKCVNCGECESQCPRDAIVEVAVAFIKETPAPAPTPEQKPVKSVRQIDKRKCKGCTLCVKTCPMKAVSGIMRRPHQIDAAKCVNCGACEPKCPFKAISETEVTL